MTTFPDSFLWGASTAAHQIEGNNTSSDLWVQENQPDSFFRERSGDACDSYHRWPEDLALLAGVGLNAYRFSIEWARIEPERGHISAAQLAHYRGIIDACLRSGITPVVTLHHFTSPHWFTRDGGWTAPGAIDDFGRYVQAVLPLLRDVAWVCTMNEPNMLAMLATMTTQAGTGGAVAGALPAPDDAVAGAVIAAHHRAREVLRGSIPAAVGWTVANQVFQSEPGAEDATREWARPREDRFIEAAAGDGFLGVQAYTRTRIGVDGALPIPDGARRTLTGWEYYPAAVGEALRHTAALLPGTPLMVTENGIATGDDAERVAYTTEALRSVAAAMADGVDVRGYLHWSWLDNYEWGSYTPTFGLVAVDRTTFARSPKPSAAWLGEVARTNGAGL